MSPPDYKPVLFPVGLLCVAEWDEENEEFFARIPEVDELEGRGDNPFAAVEDLRNQAFLRLRMG